MQVITLDAPESGTAGHLGLDIQTTGLDELRIALMDDYYEQSFPATRAFFDSVLPDGSLVNASFQPFNEATANGTSRLMATDDDEWRLMAADDG